MSCATRELLADRPPQAPTDHPIEAVLAHALQASQLDTDTQKMGRIS